MKKLIAIFLISLAGCATTQSTQVTYVQACATYGAALNIAVAMLNAHKLTNAEIAQVSALDETIYPICTGALPADPTAATQQITAAITTLTILETVKKVGP
jgi:uncharacterized lipoprotein YajG